MIDDNYDARVKHELAGVPGASTHYHALVLVGVKFSREHRWDRTRWHVRLPWETGTNYGPWVALVDAVQWAEREVRIQQAIPEGWRTAG